MYARSFSRDETRMRTFTLCVPACVQRSLRKSCWWFFTILWIKVLNFIRIGAFVLEIFAKQYWRLFNLYFLCYFAYFQNLSIKVMLNFEKYGKCLRTFANTNLKCTCIREILPYVRGMKVVLGSCIHLKLYVSSHVTPSILRSSFLIFEVILIF